MARLLAAAGAACGWGVVCCRLERSAPAPSAGASQCRPQRRVHAPLQRLELAFTHALFDLHSAPRSREWAGAGVSQSAGRPPAAAPPPLGLRLHTSGNTLLMHAPYSWACGMHGSAPSGTPATNVIMRVWQLGFQHLWSAGFQALGERKGEPSLLCDSRGHSPACSTAPFPLDDQRGKLGVIGGIEQGSHQPAAANHQAAWAPGRHPSPGGALTCPWAFAS